jgi:predicted GNAT family N-acyltransferase
LSDRIASFLLSFQKNIEQVVIHSQEYVKGLYQKIGFEQVGEFFHEAGILHIKMTKMLR